MNNVSLIGRTTDDIELRTTNNGKSVARFTLAINRNREETDFIECEAWNGAADTLATYVHKGQQIGVSGRLKQERWEKDGKKYSKLIVSATAIDLLSNGQKVSNNEPQAQKSPTPYDLENNPDYNPEEFSFLPDGEGCPF